MSVANRIFYLCFTGTLLVKSGIAYFFPFTGDEAFFYQWGIHPALGYSDHPPMVGWMLALLGAVSHSPFMLRLTTVLMSNVIALLILDSLRMLLPPDKQNKAWLGASIYLVLPWSWMPMLVTTDTPLIYFLAFSGWAYIKADHMPQTANAWYLTSGLFLAFAFLSKYFAVLLGIAFAIHLITQRPMRWMGLLLIVIPTLPAIAIHLYFNAMHGWPNIMFNLFNRNENAVWSIKTPLIYLGMMIYLLTPWLIFLGFKAKSNNKELVLKPLFVVPFAFFFLLSFKKTIGLHWVLGFIPFFVLWATSVLTEVQIKKSVVWVALFCLPHLLVMAVFIWGPLSLIQNTKWHEKMVFLRYSEQITALTKPADGGLFMATAYSPASVLSYHYGQYMPVFGTGKFHSRQDDQLINFQNFDGKNIRIFNGTAPPNLSEYTPYFSSVSTGVTSIQGVKYFYVDGQSFNYHAYKELVLAVIAEKYHRIPSWLPILGNPFCERYSFAQCSPAPK